MTDTAPTTPAAKAAPAKKAPAKKTAAKAAPAKKAAKAPAKKEAKPAALKPVAGLKPETKVKYGKDADGKLYSTSNSPHRDGSTSAAKWKAMKVPATLAAILDGGMGRGYLAFYVENEILVPA